MARRQVLTPTAPAPVIPRRPRFHNELSFAEWLVRERIHPQAFAVELGLTVGYVYALRAGARAPGARLRLRIAERSGGAVRFDGWPEA